MKMNIRRRDLFLLGGGTVAAALLPQPSTLHAESAKIAVKSGGQPGKVRILDVQSASIADEYVCNLIKITTDSGLYGIGEARPKVAVAKRIEEFKR